MLYFKISTAFEKTRIEGNSHTVLYPRSPHQPHIDRNLFELEKLEIMTLYVINLHPLHLLQNKTERNGLPALKRPHNLECEKKSLQRDKNPGR